MKLKLTLAALLLIAASAWAFDPGVYDVVMQAGEDYTLTLQLKDGTGANMDITGYTYAAQFRSAPAPGGTLFATYSASASVPASGTVRVKLSKAQTVAQTGKSGVWDLRQTEPGGNVSYLIIGKAACRPTVTR